MRLTFQNRRTISFAAALLGCVAKVGGVYLVRPPYNHERARYPSDIEEVRGYVRQVLLRRWVE